jgi:hypothetical protein
MEKLFDNYKQICENVQKALSETGRSDTVQIMAVTKTIDVELIKAAAACGVNLLGENRVQEFLSKKEDYPADCAVHFIGGLQTNKVRQIIGKVSMVQSADSKKLALEIDRQSGLNSIVTDILVQINIGGETSKNGVNPNELDDLLGEIILLPNIRLRGFMAIPPFGDTVRHFVKMQRLFEDFKAEYGGSFDTLSMGMSGDYYEAILHGATIIRIGSALFGNRS